MPELSLPPTAAPTGRPRMGGADRVLALVLAGLALTLVFVYGFLWPLDHSHHPEVAFGYQPLATVFGADDEGRFRYVGAVAASYLVFTVAVFIARRLAGPAAFWVVVAGTIILAATLIPTNPAGAQDVYHNIADARTLWVYGDNPAVTPPVEHSDDPLFKFIPAWPDTPSSYGPLWYVVSGAPIPFAGADVWANVVGQKLLTAAFLLGTTVLAMLTAARIRPGSAVLAGVLVGWNPLMQFETAGAAHNDVVMVFFAVAAFYALTRRWWDLVFPLLALAVAVKYVLILIAPVILLWMLLRRDIPRWHVARSVGAGALLGAGCYMPFFADGALLETLRGEGNRYLSSVGSFAVSLLFEQRGMDLGEAERAMKIGMWIVFGVGALLLLSRFRRHQSYGFLIGTCAALVFLFLVTVKWWFWPWYLIWLVPLAALAPRRAMALLATTFSLSAMLLYAAYYWDVYDDWHYKQQLVFMAVFATPLGLTVLLVLYPPSRWLVRKLRRTRRPPLRRAARSEASGS